MSLHQAASISNLDPEAPEKPSELRPLSACGHPPGRSAPADDRRHESSHDGQWQLVWLRALRLCACTLPNTSTRRRAGRMGTPAPTEPALRPRPCWRPASPRAGAHGLSSVVAARSVRPDGSGSRRRHRRWLILRPVAEPHLPLSNNAAEQALRHWVISRTISHGTRSEEGSRAFAFLASLIETCRRRGASAWQYLGTVIAAARKGLQLPTIPVIPATV